MIYRDDDRLQYRHDYVRMFCGRYSRTRSTEEFLRPPVHAVLRQTSQMPTWLQIPVHHIAGVEVEQSPQHLVDEVLGVPGGADERKNLATRTFIPPTAIRHREETLKFDSSPAIFDTDGHLNGWGGRHSHRISGDGTIVGNISETGPTLRGHSKGSGE